MNHGITIGDPPYYAKIVARAASARSSRAHGVAAAAAATPQPLQERANGASQVMSAECNLPVAASFGKMTARRRPSAGSSPR